MQHKWNVYQHWDPLKVCVVGRSYPPEFYSWIQDSTVRQLFEKIAIETEEDYQKIISVLKKFNVQIHRPELPANTFIAGRHLPPPMTPRDYMVMIGDTFFKGYQLDIKKFYRDIKAEDWPTIENFDDFLNLPQWMIDECYRDHQLQEYIDFYSSYDKIFDTISSNGNTIHDPLLHFTNGAYVTRCGKDLYFGTETHDTDLKMHQSLLDTKFSNTRNHIIDTQGHSDSSFCPVCPGLIVTLEDICDYSKTFPDWEVLYLPDQSWDKVTPFLHLKEKNKGKWWVPGFEYNNNVTDFVEQHLSTWVGYVEETVFDVNMLIVDPKNVIVFNYNEKVFEAFNRYGITPHVVNFRHRYFWDGGIHCVTADLHREGSMQDYFPERT
jgi:N-dimethylarginine dimethylaminohydrolase